MVGMKREYALASICRFVARHDFGVEADFLV